MPNRCTESSHIHNHESQNHDHNTVSVLAQFLRTVSYNNNKHQAIAQVMPPSVIITKIEVPRVCERRLSTSMRSLESNRNELSQPWDMSPHADVSPKDDRKSSRKNSKSDPPAMDCRRKQKTKKQGNKINLSKTEGHNMTSSTSRGHPSGSAAIQSTKSSRKTREPRFDQNILNMTKKQEPSGLYEDFPKRKPSRSRSEILRKCGERVPKDHNRCKLSCSATSLNRDKCGLFVEEVDWKNTSVDWGDDYEL